MSVLPAQDTRIPVARVANRVERPADEVGVRTLLRSAFGHRAESDLVEVLRGRNAIIGSWVSMCDERLVACAMFSPVRLEPPLSHTPVVGMAPVAVQPEFQRHGIGTRLIGYALRQVRGLGVAAVVVLGDPSYYRRFGFRPAREFGLQCDFDVPSDSFMAMQMSPGALDGYRGRAHYHHAFDSLQA